MKTTIATLISIVMLGACSSDKQTENTPQLPPITQTGTNTFGVVLNNIIFVPRSSSNDINNIGYPKYNGVLFTIDDKNFTCFISLESKNRTYIFLHVNDDSNLKTKDYNVNGQGTDNIPGRVTIKYVTYKDAIETNDYSVVPNSGTIKLTKNDTQIISGIFSCKLVNKKNPNDVLEVKDGRFDFNKATINTIKFQ
jgi:hypothetical protein